MSAYQRTISDTKTHAKVLLNFDSDNSTVTVDASALSGHANGAKLHITHMIHSITGRVELQFVGSSANTVGVDVVGNNVYYGAVIKNDATNAGATGGDIEAFASSASGYILLTLQKIGFAENA